MSTLPHLTLLLSILADHPKGLTPDQMLKALADRGTTISRPTLNRVLVEGREQGKLVAEGLTTGRTYRLAEAIDPGNGTGASMEVQPGPGEAVAPDRDIVSAYSSRVWATADVLRGVGVKQSEWPGHMMPFFAVMLLESRVLRIRRQAMAGLFEGGKTFDRGNPNHLSDLRDYYIAHTPGTNNTWHEGLLLHGEGMRTLAQGGGAGIEGRLNSYLAGYDVRTQQLLGFGKETQEKYLGIRDTIRMLAGKGSEHLADWVRHWAQVDLAAYDSAAITTLEEHVKRRWADLDAATAGEHYTPFDLFHLVAALADDHFQRHPYPEKTLTVYDPTCGGGNMLFGVADRLRQTASAQGRKLQVKTCGQEINDTLYGLAAVESRFRENADIRHGNTLTADQFGGEHFGLIVANPPYGVDWKSIVKDIDRDETGRFPKDCRPPTSDGQHLFLQHVQAHLAEHGLAFVFCSGSTLFSGSAGGGESNARLKYFQADDNVLGIIQLPKDEFFNTGIHTYLWIFKKNKPEALKHRAFFLDASGLASKLRKSLGSKRNELGEEAQASIVALVREAEAQADAMLAPARREDGRREQVLGLALAADGTDVEVVDTAQRPALLRLLDVDEVCYQKVDIELTRGNPAFDGRMAPKDFRVAIVPREALKDTDPGQALESVQQALAQPSSPGQDGILAQGLVLSSEMDLDGAIDAVARFEVEQGEALDLDDRIQQLQADPKTLVAAIKAKLSDEWAIFVSAVGKEAKARSGDVAWAWNLPLQPQARALRNQKGELGRAGLVVSAKIKKGRKDASERLALGLELSPDTEKDTETVPTGSRPGQEAAFREAFLARWVREAYTVLGTTTGCEVNFNRLFPATAQRRTLAEVNQALAELDAKIAALHQGAGDVA